MMDYEPIICYESTSKIERERVKGKVFCEVTQNNILVVEIKSRGDWKFSMEFDNFSDRFLNGFTTDYAMCDVLSKYRKFITNRYFIKEA